MSQSGPYAILSDVHANEEALRTVLAFLDEVGVSKIISLGDIAGYGQGASTCIHMLRERNAICIQGNHDASIRPPRDQRMRQEAVTALEVANAQLSEEEKDWLAELPTARIFDNQFLCVHGAISGRDDYILNQEAVDENIRLLREQYTGIDICFFGHTHLSMVLTVGGARAKFPETDSVQLKRTMPYLINPGSVGQPRDGVPHACFALYDPEDHQVIINRLPYDIEAEIQRMQSAGLPSKLCKRLQLGK